LGTSTPGSWPPIAATPTPATPSRRRRVAIASVVIPLAVLVSIAGWVAAAQDDGNSSHEGCLTIIVASSTGGARLHACGDKARAVCRAAYTNDDKLALLSRTQCKLAGIDPPAP
jgi:hypothetical protein